MQRISESAAEKLNYQPGVFTVERRICSKCVCKAVRPLPRGAVAPHVIAKGLPTHWPARPGAGVAN